MAKFVDAATIIEVKDVKVSEAFYNEKLGFGPGFFYGDPPASASSAKAARRFSSINRVRRGRRRSTNIGRLSIRR